MSGVANFEPGMELVALPTINKHIRERGFDHMALLARKTARLNGLKTAKVLARGNNAVQVGASMEKRQEQAKTAYIARDGIDVEASYLLIDDVWTTGSSMMAAAKTLREAGCKNLNIAVIAKSG